MRILLLSCLLSFLGLVICSAQWSPEDYEIFRLNDEVKKDLGEDVSLYDWFELTEGPKSSQKEIQKAIRRKSRALHPDKLGSLKGKAKKLAVARYQRLSVAGNILRDASSRRRYDFFYKNGFPKLKGTDYLYSRFRPGLIFTLVVVFLLVSGLHFFALKINRQEEYKRMAAIRRDIKQQAWGGSLIPPADGSDRRVSMGDSGRTFVVKPTGKVYLQDEESRDVLHLFDECLINTLPGFKDSLAFRLPCWLYNKSIGRITGKVIDTSVEFEYEILDESSEPQEPKKTKKKAPKGEKIELPNGKVVFGRSSGTRKR